MSLCDACYNGAGTFGGTLTGASLVIDQQTRTWAKGEIIYIDQITPTAIDYASGDYIYTPISGAFVVTSFSAYVPSDTGAPVPAVIGFTRPTGGTFHANGYNKKAVLDGMTYTDTANILVGMQVSGPGVPDNTFVLDMTSSTVTLSSPLTLGNPSSAYGDYVFTPTYEDGTALYYTETTTPRGCGTWKNVTSQFSALSITVEGSASHSIAVTGGDSSSATTYTFSVGGGESQTIDDSASSSVEASLSLSSTDTLSAYVGDYDPNDAAFVASHPIPAGQFIVLQCGGCCRPTCFYKIVFTPPTGATLLGTGDKGAATGSASASSASSHVVTGYDPSSYIVSTETTQGFVGDVVAFDLVYTDAIATCSAAGDTSQGGEMPVEVEVQWGGAGGSAGWTGTKQVTTNGTVTNQTDNIEATGVLSLLTPQSVIIYIDPCNLAAGGTWSLAIPADGTTTTVSGNTTTVVTVAGGVTTTVTTVAGSTTTTSGSSGGGTTYVTTTTTTDTVTTDVQSVTFSITAGLS